MNLSTRIKGLAREAGFDRAAIASVEVPVQDRDFLVRWLGEGKAADMARWLARSPERRADPASFLPGALSVISLGVGYYRGPVPPAPGRAYGRVARYAWGLDYHDAIAARLETLRAALALEIPGLVARPAVDAQPLLERAFARRAGLGFAGKNTNLIVPGAGSWLFLTELVVNVALTPDEPMLPSRSSAALPARAVGRSSAALPARAVGCGGCRECQTGCPTGALDEPFQLDARLCVSYHTIENRGTIPVELRPKFGPWLFGCDDCQEICPFNARPLESSWPELSPERGTGPWLSLAEVLSLRDKSSFEARFQGTPLLRAKRSGLVRNACVAARNAGVVDELRPLLEERRDLDESLVVREHAAWALEGA